MDLSSLLTWIPVLLPLAVVCTALVFSSVHFRLALLVIGTLFVFQSSRTIDVTKIIYLVAFAVIFGIAVYEGVLVSRGNRRIVLASLVLFGLVGFSFVVAVLRGNGAANWVRDVTGLLLFAAAPILAIDAERAGSIPVLELVFCVSGIFAAIAFSVEFVGGAHVNDTLKGSNPALATAMLPIALFCYSSAMMLNNDRNRLLWSCITAVLTAIFLLSARRGSIALVAILAFVAVFQGGIRFRTLLTTAVVALIALAVFFSTLGYFSQVVGQREEAVTRRLASLVLLVENPRKDGSFEARLSETLAATASFLEEPVLGVGPGHIFLWRSYNGKVGKTFSIVDTPMAIPAKYGLVGVGLFGFAFLVFCSFIVRMIRVIGRSSCLAAIAAFTAYSFFRTFIGPPFDDKGYGIGVLFLLALCLLEAKARTMPSPEQPA